jgi:lactam utilization protein B
MTSRSCIVLHIAYCVPVPRAQIGHNATPYPAPNDRASSILHQIHGLQLEVATTKKTTSDKVRCNRKLYSTKNEKERHIEVITHQVQALQAHITILQRQNNNLYLAAAATKTENASDVPQA